MKTNRAAHRLLLCNSLAAIRNDRPQTAHGPPAAPGHKTESESVFVHDFAYVYECVQ